MTDLAHLIQDLRAEAHRAPADVAELMRTAAAELDRRRGLVILGDLIDAMPQPPPFPPPAEGAPCD